MNERSNESFGRTVNGALDEEVRSEKFLNRPHCLLGHLCVCVFTCDLFQSFCFSFLFFSSTPHVKKRDHCMDSALCLFNQFVSFNRYDGSGSFTPTILMHCFSSKFLSSSENNCLPTGCHDYSEYDSVLQTLL